MLLPQRLWPRLGRRTDYSETRGSRLHRHGWWSTRRAGDKRREIHGLTWLALSLFHGPTPADEALRLLEEEPDLDAVVPFRKSARAMLLAMLGRFEEARGLIAGERAHFVELGAIIGDALVACNQGKIELFAADPTAAELVLRQGCDRLDAMGEQGFLSTFVVELGQALYALGRLEEASNCADRGKALGATDDNITQMLWRQLRAKVLARRGDVGTAELLAREAVEIGEPTDSLESRGTAYCDLAEVLELAGRPADAAIQLERALELYRQKGVVVVLPRVDERLARLRAVAT